MKTKHIFSLGMIFVMLAVLCTLSGCKGKQGKEIEVDVSSDLSSVVSVETEGSDAADGEGSVPSKQDDGSAAEQTDASSKKATSSDGTVIIGEDVVIDMGEELF